MTNVVPWYESDEAQVRSDTSYGSRMAPKMADNLSDLDVCENEEEPESTERRVHFSSRVSTPISSPATSVHTTMSTTTCSTTCATTSTSTVMTTGARCFGDAANYSRASMLPPVRLSYVPWNSCAPDSFRVLLSRACADSENFSSCAEFYSAAGIGASVEQRGREY
ncbi:hypothetical protein TKK_0018800 [Trichogramma kaykai]